MELPLLTSTSADSTDTTVDAVTNRIAPRARALNRATNRAADYAALAEAEEGFETEERRPSRRTQMRPSQADVAKSLAEEGDPTAEFVTTYQPSRHEAGWLLSSLKSFYDDGFITDILAQVKGGKEASVYRCLPKGDFGIPFIAAKVYRPRQFRNLRNDALYKEGREVLGGTGQAVKKSDTRTMKALGKKTEFGMQVAHTSWLLYEYTTLTKLHDAGVPVPRPYAVGENAILMGYVGDGNIPAPTLIEVSLTPHEAKPLFQTVMNGIETMLAAGMVHGDLSAYNILYWEGAVTIIDFPQVSNRDGNPHAREIFARDVRRVCEYFGRQGVRCDAEIITNRLWRRYASE